MLRVELHGYFPVDGCKFREAYYCNTEDQRLAVVQATQFVLCELKNYHNKVMFTRVLVTNVDSARTSYGEKFPSNDFCKEKSVEHHAEQAVQKMKEPDPIKGY